MNKEKIKTIINDDWCHMFTPEGIIVRPHCKHDLKKYITTAPISTLHYTVSPTAVPQSQEPYSTIPPVAPPIPQEPYWYAGSEETELTHFLRKC